MTKTKANQSINKPHTGKKEVKTVIDIFLDDNCEKTLVFSSGETLLADRYSGLWRGNVDLGKYDLNTLKH